MKTLTPDQGTSTQGRDLPLSDGFQWEAVSGTSSEPCMGLSQWASQAHRELQRDSKPCGQSVSVREEHIKNYEKEDFSEPSSSGTMKRKATKVSH